jgi:hypothetical protein
LIFYAYFFFLCFTAMKERKRRPRTLAGMENQKARTRLHRQRNYQQTVHGANYLNDLPRTEENQRPDQRLVIGEDQKDELASITEENQRLTAANKRLSEETVRLKAENIYLKNNNLRWRAETIALMKTNEGLTAARLRLQAENERLTAENIRLTAENVFLIAENTRL